MSGPYRPAPRRLTRSTSHKLLGGVCGGVADYLNMDANLVRILTVVITLFTGVPILLYLLALFLLPEDVNAVPPSVHGPGPESGPYGYAPQQDPTVAPQPYAGSDPALAPRHDEVWGSAGAPWDQPPAAGEPTQQRGEGETGGRTNPPDLR